jgi:ectoine hydroxylase-related dioxygenase (phytanoyl-CoA dioxygenase family)
VYPSGASGSVVTGSTAEAAPFDAFCQRGYALLPSLLDPDEMDGARHDADEVLAAPRPGGCDRPFNALTPLRWNDRVVRRVLTSPPGVAAIADAIGATDLRWISGYVSVKAAHSPPLWWHQDWWCCDHPVTFRAEPAQVSVLCYLSPTDRCSAALRVIPGSHRPGTALHPLLATEHSTNCDALDLADPAFRDHPMQQTLALNAGDAIAIDYRLLHGTHHNQGTTDRHCILLNFAPSWDRLPEDIRAHLIQSPALPTSHEVQQLPDTMRELLPNYDGAPIDLPLNRVPSPGW